MNRDPAIRYGPLAAPRVHPVRATVATEPGSSGLSVVVSQQPTQPLATHHPLGVHSSIVKKSSATRQSQ
jgi:hypothetical protein